MEPEDDHGGDREFLTAYVRSVEDFLTGRLPEYAPRIPVLWDREGWDSSWISATLMRDFGSWVIDLVQAGPLAADVRRRAFAVVEELLVSTEALTSDDTYFYVLEPLSAVFDRFDHSEVGPETNKCLSEAFFTWNAAEGSVTA
jgi:hypothetical protein